MNINTYQAEMLWLRFTTTEAFSDAEMVAGHKLENDNRCQFLLTWAVALANGNTSTLDSLLDTLCDSEPAKEGTTEPAQLDSGYQPSSGAGYIKVKDRQPVPGPQFPAHYFVDARKVKPKYWDTWPAAYRERWLAEQVKVKDTRLWHRGIGLREFSRKVGLHPTKIYNRSGPEAYRGQRDAGDRIPTGWLVRHGSRVRIHPDHTKDLHDWLAAKGFPTKSLTG